MVWGSNDILYRKVGRRYRKVGYDFSGWPTDGVWMVQGGQCKSRLICTEDELPKLRLMTLAALELHRDTTAAALIDKKSWCIDELITACFKALAERTADGSSQT